MSGHVGTQEVRIDLSATAPRVYVDGREVATIIEVTYVSPPAEPLTVEEIRLRVKR